MLRNAFSPILASELASGHLTQGDDRLVSQFATLALSHAESLSFSESKASKTCHGAVIVKTFQDDLPHAFQILNDSPRIFFQTLLQTHFQDALFTKPSISTLATVHASAVVEGEVKDHCSIGPLCWVASGALLEEGVILEAGVKVYAGVHLQKGTVVQAGAVLGSSGFGIGETGSLIPHFAGVSIGPDSFIGANSVVAAGYIHPTCLGKECRLDSFVQIGHNAQLGDRVIMVSQSGVAGSSILEDDVQVGGGAQIAGHLSIAAGTQIAAKAGVTKSLPKGVYGGYPAQPLRSWHKMQITLRNLL